MGAPPMVGPPTREVAWPRCSMSNFEALPALPGTSSCGTRRPSWPMHVCEPSKNEGVTLCTCIRLISVRSVGRRSISRFTSSFVKIQNFVIIIFHRYQVYALEHLHHCIINC